MPLISYQLVIPVSVNYSWTVKQMRGVISNPSQIYKHYPPTGEGKKAVDLQLIQFNFRKWQFPHTVVRALNGINMRPADGSELMAFLYRKPKMIQGSFAALGAKYFNKCISDYDGSDFSGWQSLIVDCYDSFDDKARNIYEIRESFIDEREWAPNLVYLAVKK
jgi:hypothetical protein